MFRVEVLEAEFTEEFPTHDMRIKTVFLRRFRSFPAVTSFLYFDVIRKEEHKK